jgi:hypothetical protein
MVVAAAALHARQTAVGEACRENMAPLRVPCYMTRGCHVWCMHICEDPMGTSTYGAAAASKHDDGTIALPSAPNEVIAANTSLSKPAPGLFRNTEIVSDVDAGKDSTFRRRLGKNSTSDMASDMDSTYNHRNRRNNFVVVIFHLSMFNACRIHVGSMERAPCNNANGKANIPRKA